MTSRPERTLPTPVALACAAGLLFTGCSRGIQDDLPPEMFRSDVQPETPWHRGPDVFVAPTGTARFAPKLDEAFSTERAMATVRFADRWYRAPGSPGFDRVLDHVIERLEDAGFGVDPRLELRTVERRMSDPAWWPLAASLELVTGDGAASTLHSFRSSEDRDRCLLPVNASSCDVDGPIALHLADVERGSILVTEASATQVLGRARAKGAAAVVSASLRHFNADPSGAERHLDAIQFVTVPADAGIPVMQISPRSFAAVVAAGEGSRLRLRAEVRTEHRPLRTVIATVVGDERPDDAVVLSSHVQEPGASDNASGVAGLLESAVDLARLLGAGELGWPSRSVAFCWGDEFLQTEVWLESSPRTAIAGFSSDMTGQSKDTGAIALLERMPDPGALVTLQPDQHSAWGAGDVAEEDLAPNGLAIVARCALVDTGLLHGGWPCADHPWEGGSDHDVFIELGIPAVLFWHFTDFTYHTSLDRIEFVDPEEIRRTAVALLSSALAVADAVPGDLDRYLKSLAIEEQVRCEAARAEGDIELERLWREWCRGARQWLRNLCLGIDEELPVPDER